MIYFSQSMLHILHRELIRFAFRLRHRDGKPIILSQWVAPMKMQRAFSIISRCLLPSASLHNSPLPIKFSSASPGSHLSQRQLGLGYAQLTGRSSRGDRSLSTWPWKKKDASRRDDTSIQRARQPPKINVEFVRWHIPSSARKKKLPLQETAELRKPRSSSTCLTGAHLWPAHSGKLGLLEDWKTRKAWANWRLENTEAPIVHWPLWTVATGRISPAMT